MEDILSSGLCPKMSVPQLSDELYEKYLELKPAIQSRLADFKSLPEDEYFYEFCYCICTPQSKAANAGLVQAELMEMDFLNNPFDPVWILRKPNRYIRFHNQKAIRLLRARDEFPGILNMLNSDLDNYSKRDWLESNFSGFGMKESSHFLRNIGYDNLAILDRHILRHLINCEVFDELPKINNAKHYREAEKKFLIFADRIGIPMDELDLLFWAFSAGEILK